MDTAANSATATIPGGICGVETVVAYGLSPSAASFSSVDEKGVYPYCAVDKHGDTTDFYLSRTRITKAGNRFP